MDQRRCLMFIFSFFAMFSFAGPAFSANYIFSAPGQKGTNRTVENQITPPKGTHRVKYPPGSFSRWMQTLPLLEESSPVHLYDGSLKSQQDLHTEVVDLDIGPFDLQQCADAVMRLRVEYLESQNQRILFHPNPGSPKALEWQGGDRSSLSTYLIQLFRKAGSVSLQAEMIPATKKLQPGDVLAQGGYPGHMVMIVDVAEDSLGHQFLLLGQSYMPAQQFHLLKNLSSKELSPFYDADSLDLPKGLKTPEWAPFFRKDAYRFKPQGK